MADQEASATELAALEEELRASARDGQADDLADAVEAALRNPAAAYSHATLQAAFARYAENRKDAESRKDRDKGQRGAPAPAKAAAAAPKTVRSPAAKRADSGDVGGRSPRRRIRGRRSPSACADRRLAHGGGRAGPRGGAGGHPGKQEAPPGRGPGHAGVLASGAWARRLCPRPAGEPIPCDPVRDSSSHGESPDAYPRRMPSPTQPWPPPGQRGAADENSTVELWLDN